MQENVQACFKGNLFDIPWLGVEWLLAFHQELHLRISVEGHTENSGINHYRFASVD
jgi:hypothetical protein